jgi:excisionase family DNA binding protein
MDAVVTVLEVGPDEVGSAELKAIERVVRVEPSLTPRLVGADGSETAIPEEIHGLLVTIVEQLLAGNGVTVVPLHAELTTVEAARLLNVSRPHLIKQIAAGAIPHHMVGTHRRLKLRDVLAYRDDQDERADRVLDEMAKDAQELGLYD